MINAITGQVEALATFEQVAIAGVVATSVSVSESGMVSISFFDSEARHLNAPSDSIEETVSTLGCFQTTISVATDVSIVCEVEPPSGLANGGQIRLELDAGEISSDLFTPNTLVLDLRSSAAEGFTDCGVVDFLDLPEDIGLASFIPEDLRALQCIATAFADRRAFLAVFIFPDFFEALPDPLRAQNNPFINPSRPAAACNCVCRKGG